MLSDLYWGDVRVSDKVVLSADVLVLEMDRYGLKV